MRAFVGIALPPLPPVTSLLEDLRGCGADLKVVEPGNLHLTLKFLGDIPDAQAPVIVERLSQAGFPTGYALRLHRVGAFPDWKKLNIVWIGLSDPEGKLAASFVLNEKAFAEIGVPNEPRPFTPHLTVARKRSDHGKDRAKDLLNRFRDHEFGEATVRGPRLFKSTLTPKGSIYEDLGGAG